MNDNSISIPEYQAMQKKAGKGKYKNKICRTDDILDMVMDSLGELAYYNRLKLLVNAGEVTHFHTQVPIRLPGNTKYVVDFLVFYADGHHEYVDYKGCVTSLFRLKKKQVEAMYPLNIRCVVRKGKNFIDKKV